jgi:hypothetical protein
MVGGTQAEAESVVPPDSSSGYIRRPFRYYITDIVQELLHDIDSGAGGLIGIPDPITNPQTRDRYVVSSLIVEATTSSQLEGAVATREAAKEMIKSGRKPRDRSE